MSLPVLLESVRLLITAYDSFSRPFTFNLLVDLLSVLVVECVPPKYVSNNLCVAF